MSRRRAAVLTALALLAAPVATAGTAHAGTWSHQDARGDVMRFSMTDDGETITRDPSDKTTDITRISVNHSARKVTVTLKVRDLTRGDAMVVGRLVTPKSDFSVLVVRSAEMRMFTLTDQDADEVAVRCRGKKISLDAALDRIRLTLPRTCLGSPKWVRAGAALVRGDLMSIESSFTVDEALRPGNKAIVGTRPIKVGKKVRAG